MGGHLHLNNVVLDRVNDQVADRVETQFPHDIAAVCFRGFGAQVQQRRYFFRALSFRQQLSNFALPGG